MSQLLLRTFRELPLLTVRHVLLSDPAGLLWGSSRGGGDGAGLAELSLTSYVSTTHPCECHPPCTPTSLQTGARARLVPLI